MVHGYGSTRPIPGTPESAETHHQAGSRISRLVICPEGHMAYAFHPLYFVAWFRPFGSGHEWRRDPGSGKSRNRPSQVTELEESSRGDRRLCAAVHGSHFVLRGND